MSIGMALVCSVCDREEQLAEIGRFIFQHKKQLHPSYATLDTLSVIYSYVTEGHIIQVTDEENRIAGMTAFYHGTKENGFQDKDIIFIDIAIASTEVRQRASRVFVMGLAYLLEQVAERFPEAKRIRLVALSDNRYVCKLYSKFVRPVATRPGERGEETVFEEEITRVGDYLRKLGRV